MSGYRDAMRSYATFQGRTSHRAFLRAHWIFLPLIVFAFGVVGVPFLEQRPPGGLGSRSIWPTLLFLLIVLPHALPWAALMVRRLHDMDRSGAWALLALIPYGFIVPFPLAVLVLWGSQPGTAGPNRFGPEPKAHDVTVAQAGRPASPISANMTSPSVAPQRDVITEIERLAQLRASGALSESEFELMKAHALGQGGRA